MEQENTGLFTVQQFALQVGKSSQAIYQQLKGRLKDYVKKGEGGQVLIKAEALKLYKEKQTSQPATVDKDIQALQSEADSLKAENEGLRARITNLELHIEELNAANEAAEDANKAQGLRIAGLEKDVENLKYLLAREQETSRERLERAEKAEQRSEAADRRIDNLLDKIPPMLPAGNAGGGLFGWLKRKKGDTNT